MKLNDYVKKGERWYVKRPGALALSHVAVTDVTDNTIEVQSVENTYDHATRYEKSALTFIEKTGPFPPGE